MLKLNKKELIHNNGSDLWDFMFENQKLPKRFSEEDDEMDDWFEDGISWLKENLLDGEVFEFFEDDERFAYTSLGRHANIKKKTFKALTLQGNSIAGNMSGGAFSVSKAVKQKWNITLDYRKLPYEVTQYIVTTNASKALKEWIKNNE